MSAAFPRDLADAMNGNVVQMRPSRGRTEREISASAVDELAAAEVVLDAAGVPGEPGEPLPERLQAWLKPRGLEET